MYLYSPIVTFFVTNNNVTLKLLTSQMQVKITFLRFPPHYSFRNRCYDKFHKRATRSIETNIPRSHVHLREAAKGKQILDLLEATEQKMFGPSYYGSRCSKDMRT